jgi:hypothetical protein
MPQSQPSLPTDRAFVLLFRIPLTSAPSSYEGRVVHMVLGQVARSHSLEELLAFMIRVVTDVHKQSDPPRARRVPMTPLPWPAWPSPSFFGCNSESAYGIHLPTAVPPRQVSGTAEGVQKLEPGSARWKGRMGVHGNQSGKFLFPRALTTPQIRWLWVAQRIRADLAPHAPRNQFRHARQLATAAYRDGG